MFHRTTTIIPLMLLMGMLAAADNAALSALLPGVWRGYATFSYTTYHWYITITKTGKGFRGKGVGWSYMPDDIALSLAKGKGGALPNRGWLIGEEFQIALDGDQIIMVGAPPTVISKETGKIGADSFRAVLTAPGVITGHLAFTDDKSPTYQLALCKEELWNQPGSSSVTPGQTVEVACDGLPSHYQLHVPKTYDPAKAWPLLIHHSPGGNAQPYDAALADDVGWISVGLTESKNGPWAPIVQNRDAALFDLRRKLNVDWKRVTFGGESGGSRASLVAWFNQQSITTSLLMIIAGNADQTPMPPPSVPIFFITGMNDMNRVEVENAFQTSKKNGRPTDIIVHNGGHEDGGAENVNKALRWLWEHQPKTVETKKKK